MNADSTQIINRKSSIINSKGSPPHSAFRNQTGPTGFLRITYYFRSPASYQIHCPLERFQFILIGEYYLIDIMVLSGQPIWPAEVSTLFYEIIGQRFKCHRVFFDSKETSPTSTGQPKGEPAAAGKDINIGEDSV
jgi:hypothetical protein